MTDVTNRTYELIDIAGPSTSLFEDFGKGLTIKFLNGGICDLKSPTFFHSGKWSDRTVNGEQYFTLHFSDRAYNFKCIVIGNEPSHFQLIEENSPNQYYTFQEKPGIKP